jgi:cell wall-associated NlpC family hydrolase
VAFPPVNAESCPPSHRPTGKLRRIAALSSALTVVAAGLTLLVSTSAAQAAPTLSQQITELNNQIESVVEQYNGVTTRLVADQKASAQLGAVLPTMQLQAQLAEQRANSVIRDLYIAGPGSGLAMLMDTSSTQQLIDQMGMLSVIGRHQRQDISNTHVVISNYLSKKQTLDTLIKQETAQKAVLAAKKQQILASLAHLRTLQAAEAAAAAKAAAAKAAAAKAAAATSTTSASSCAGVTPTSKTSRCYVMPVACPQVSSGGAGYTAAKKACSLVWPTIHWYGWAQAGPSEYDCSGLTMVAWKAAGVTLLHFTGDQWNESHAISKSDLRVGDLVFYNSGHHVAIYIGNGWIVQAENTGEPLKESPITFMPVVPNGYRRVNGT